MKKLWGVIEVIVAIPVALVITWFPLYWVLEVFYQNDALTSDDIRNQLATELAYKHSIELILFLTFGIAIYHCVNWFNSLKKQ